MDAQHLYKFREVALALKANPKIPPGRGRFLIRNSNRPAPFTVGLQPLTQLLDSLRTGVFDGTVNSPSVRLPPPGNTCAPFRLDLVAAGGAPLVAAPTILRILWGDLLFRHGRGYPYVMGRRSYQSVAAKTVRELSSAYPPLSCRIFPSTHQFYYKRY